MPIEALKNLPRSLERFVSPEKEIDFESLNKEPTKLLKFFLSQEHKSPEIQTNLLSRRDLSAYHFMKLICSCPHLISGREEELKNKTSSFADQLAKDPHNVQLLGRAAKISRLVTQNKRLSDLIGNILDRSFAIENNKTIKIDRFQWLEKTLGWRSMLVGNFPQKDPLNGSEKILLAVDQFIRSATLPDLTFEEIVQLHAKAGELCYEDLQKACCQKLMSHLNHDQVLQILQCGLSCKEESLIQACITFVNSCQTDFQFSWTVIRGLQIEIKTLGEESNVPAILESPLEINGVILPNETIVDELLQNKICFPTASCLSLKTEIQPSKFIALRTCFPNAKKCVLPKTLYAKLDPLQTASWNALEILHLTGPIVVAERPDLFKNLTLILADPDPKNPEQNTFRIIPKQTSICVLGACEEGMMTFSSRATEQIIFEIIEQYPEVDYVSFRDSSITDRGVLTLATHFKDKLKQIRFETCPCITDQTCQTLAKHLPNLEHAAFLDCRLTDRGVKALATHLSHLTCLELSNCPLLTDRCIWMIGLHLRNLESFKIENCKQFTDHIRTPLSSLENLQSLNLEGCSGLTDLTGIEIVKKLRRLVSLFMSNTSMTERVFLKDPPFFRNLEEYDGPAPDENEDEVP